MSLTSSRLSAKAVALLIDQANDDLGRQAEDKDVVFERALRWAAELGSLGVTDATVERVFQVAMQRKTDKFPLAIVDLRQAARDVLVKQDSPAASIRPLDEGECVFLLSMIPAWYGEKTERSRTYLLEQRGYFERYAKSPHERAVLTALQALDLREDAYGKVEAV